MHKAVPEFEQAPIRLKMTDLPWTEFVLDEPGKTKVERKCCLMTYGYILVNFLVPSESVEYLLKTPHSLVGGFVREEKQQAVPDPVPGVEETRLEPAWKL